MTDTSKPVRVALIGAGGNTRARHLPGFLALPGVSIAGVANRTLESARRFADEFALPRASARWRELVDDHSVDAVCIGTWPATHAEITEAALHAGKHVLCEARMAASLPEAEAMLTTSRRFPQLVAQLVPAPYALDVNAAARDILASGRLGALREVCVVNTGGQFARADAPISWRQETAHSGINMLALGIFHEMVLHWLGGENPAWVQADAAIFTAERPGADGPPRKVDVPDTLGVTGRWRNGARLAYHFSGVDGGAPRAEIRLNGANACLRFDALQNAFFLADHGVGGGTERPVDVPSERRRGWRVEEDFIASIRTGAPVRFTSFEDGVRYMRFTQAVWRSWNAAGARVEL